MADCRSLSLGVYAERGDYSRSVKLNISGASESFVAWLSADLLHLIGGGIVGSMPLSRTQQQTADLFQAAGVQEVLSHTHFGTLDRCAEKLSSRHVLPRDLSNALKQLDDGELDRLFAATHHELQRRGRSLTSTPVTRPTTMWPHSSVRAQKRLDENNSKGRAPI